MVDHNVMRLYVSVHNSFAMAVIQTFEQLVDVVSNIDIVELGVETPEVCVVDIFEDERRSFTL